MNNSEPVTRPEANPFADRWELILKLSATDKGTPVSGSDAPRRKSGDEPGGTSNVPIGFRSLATL